MRRQTKSCIWQRSQRLARPLSRRSPQGFGRTARTARTMARRKAAEQAHRYAQHYSAAHPQLEVKAATCCEQLTNVLYGSDDPGVLYLGAYRRGVRADDGAAALATADGGRADRGPIASLLSRAWRLFSGFVRGGGANSGPGAGPSPARGLTFSETPAAGAASTLPHSRRDGAGEIGRGGRGGGRDDVPRWVVRRAACGAPGCLVFRVDEGGTRGVWDRVDPPFDIPC